MTDKEKPTIDVSGSPMTPPYRKKLIEVALPLKAINEASAREKSIRHGHPSTLHLWWARRPLAACRAVLFSSLVDDPDSDPAYQRPDGTVDEEAAATKRADLFNLIEELVQWANSNDPDVIRSARAEIARCVASRKIETGELQKETVVGEKTTAQDLVLRGHCRPLAMGLDKKAGRVRFSLDTTRLPPAEVVNAFLAEHAPPVLDPFAGGGSIPLEAQRLGLRAYASDLNPIPVLINKSLIEIPPKFAGRPPVNPEARGEGTAKGKGKKSKALIEKEWPGATGLAEDVRYYGKWMRDEAEKRIGHLYPKVEVTEEMAQDRPDLLPYVGQELTVIAWLWARTVASPNPACGGAHVPLTRSFWLSTKKGKEAWIQPIVDSRSNSYRLTVKTGPGDPPPGTIGKRKDYCLISETPLSRSYIREEGRAQRLGQRLMAIVAQGARERVYLSASVHCEEATDDDTVIWKPDTEIPNTRYTTPFIYGMTTYAHIFCPRQLQALTMFSDLVGESRSKVCEDSQEDNAYGDAVATYLAFSVDKAADYWSNLCSWHSSKELIRNTFGRQALSMCWDFAEANPLQFGTGGFGTQWSEKVLATLPCSPLGTVDQRDARAIGQGGASEKRLICTDPPYYDNVPYADLSDFFYLWLRRALKSVYPQLLNTVLVPKAQELVADPIRQGGQEAAHAYFECGMADVFSKMRSTIDADMPTTIFYAFRQTEDDENAEVSGDDIGATPLKSDTRTSTGWETFLQSLTGTDWQISGTWPMRTEMGNRTRSMSSNALASSIVLVCRPRPQNASLATRKEFITALRRELPDALLNLQYGNIAPVDLAQAAIGPGMAVFTRYAKVVESDGSAMTVRTALGIINQVLDEVLAEQEGDFDSDTRWALSWFEQFGTDEGEYGVAETLSKAKNTAVNGLVEAGVVKAKSGKVRLIRRDELPADWNPATDKRLTVWETVQHLIHTLETRGEAEAAALVNRLGGMAETARELAYRLYSICERNKWAEEALAYNGLVIAWPELTKLALAERNRQPQQSQREMFQ